MFFCLRDFVNLLALPDIEKLWDSGYEEVEGEHTPTQCTINYRL